MVLGAGGNGCLWGMKMLGLEAFLLVFAKLLIFAKPRHTSELKNQGFCLSLRFAKLNKGDRRGQHQRTLCAYDLRNSIPPIQGTIRNFASKEANTMSSEQALADGICSLLGGPEYFTLLCP